MRNLSIKLRPLFALLLLLLVPTALCAQQLNSRSEYQQVKYTLDPTTMTASASKSTNQYLTVAEIPDIVYDTQGRMFSVVAISSDAFKGCTALEDIKFGANVKTIGANAFAGCEKLESVILPEGIEEVLEGAFMGCVALKNLELPSTLKALTKNSFNHNTVNNQLKTIRLNTANYDAEGNLSGLKLLPAAFSNRTLNDPECTLYVPKKAESWYRNAYGNNWGNYFKDARLQAFGSAPSGYSVSPSSQVADYRDLKQIEVKFSFDDENLTENVTLADGDKVNATLLVGGNVRIPADPTNISVGSNAIRIDFTQLLDEYKELFIAKSEAETSVSVELLIDGGVQIEQCPFDLTEYFAYRRIQWEVPLLPYVYDLPQPPVVAVGGEAEADGRYPYQAFRTMTLTFPGLQSITLDSKTGAYISATILKDGEPLTTATSGLTSLGNMLTIPFTIPSEQLLVRRSEAPDSYSFTLSLKGQIHASDGNNYSFEIPASDTEAPLSWSVKPEFYPEPTGVQITPAAGTLKLADLSHVSVEFEGVKSVYAVNFANDSLVAELLLNGNVMATANLANTSCSSNKMRINFGTLDEGLITLITDREKSYNVSLRLCANMMTDGYLCRTLVGMNESEAPESEAYTLAWASPRWDVPAIVRELPQVAVSTPLADDGVPASYEQLRTIDLCIENYATVVPMTNAADSPSALLMSSNNSEYNAESITTHDNHIVIEFGENLTFRAVGLYDNEESRPIELVLEFEGDFLFDGLPYHLKVNRSNEGATWELESITIRELPAPEIAYEDGRIVLSVDEKAGDVTYHYSVTNADATIETTAVAEKGKGGSSLLVPLQRTYEISVYVSRENFEDSPVTTARLVLSGEPEVITK